MSERTIATNAKAASTGTAKTTEFKLPELLAPVGGREQLVAAVNNGADAVYMGGSLFNARMKAENFSPGTGEESELKSAIDYAHSWGVRVYITLNTLIKDAELPRAFEYACSLYEMGADAVILQDMGLARLIHEYLPDFPMHLSTQGTVYNRSGVEMAAEMGFSRVVPARECSLEEIAKMCRGGKMCSDAGSHGTSDPEIEVFVHGALCMCYSGQCQMSRMLGGGSARSGNRGLCAQPCRLQYKDDKGRVSYALSPKDICTLDDLPALCEAGVDSFKIEGRLKSAEYVAVVTEIYRKYLDKFGALRARGEDINSFEIAPEDRRKLLQIFNRGGFTEGYLHGNPGAEILSGHSPKNQGIPVGKVTAITPVKTGRNADDKNRWLADVKLFRDESISMGDGVELEQCGNVVTYLAEMGKDILRIGDLKTDRSSRINVGETVYKVTDKKLCEEALKQASIRKTKADMVFTGYIGECAELQFMVDGKIFVARSENPIEMAMKKPADPERIKEQLSRLGDTPFEAGKVHIRADENAMIPVSLINSLRRQTADMALSGRQWSREEVAQDIIAKAIKETADTGAEKDFDDLTFAEGKVLVPLEVFMEKSTKKDDKKPQENLEEIPYILNVTKGNLDAYIEEHFEEIKEAVKHCGIVIGNLGWIREFQKAGVKVYGDYGLNVYNRQAVLAFAEEGVDVLEWSDELSTRICRREPKWMNRIPLMITEHPLDTDYLVDRKGVRHNIMKWYSGDKFLIF